MENKCLGNLTGLEEKNTVEELSFLLYMLRRLSLLVGGPELEFGKGIEARGF